MKTCTKCHEAKPLAMFRRRWDNMGDGLISQCKACDSAWRVMHRAANPTKVRASDRKYALANPAKRAAHEAARRARKAGAPVAPICALAYSDLRNHCKVFELLTGESFAIDHIIPLARGGAHSAENLRPLPSRLNAVKNSKLDHEVTSEEFQSHLAATGSSFEQVTWRSFHCGSET